jgi:uncharacterized protein YcbK (DUF882 family)
MKYFTIAELTASTIANQRGIDNTPPQDVVISLTKLIERLLDPIRTKWDKPITVNSGYRSDALNKAVGGVPTSNHLFGYAADIEAGSNSENKRLFEMIKQMKERGEIDFDELIDESNFSWVHIAYREGNNRGRITKIV